MERREVRTKRASLRWPIVNFDVYCGGGQKMEEKTHSDLLLNQARCILWGPSNPGKTNLTTNLLFDLNGLHFENVHICIFKVIVSSQVQSFGECSFYNWRNMILSIHWKRRRHSSKTAVIFYFAPLYFNSI